MRLSYQISKTVVRREWNVRFDSSVSANVLCTSATIDAPATDTDVMASQPSSSLSSFEIFEAELAVQLLWLPQGSSGDESGAPADW